MNRRSPAASRAAPALARRLRRNASPDSPPEMGRFRSGGHYVDFPLTALLGDARGATAMLFAVTLPVVFVATGAALDYSEAVRLHTKLDAAADAAVLTAVAPGMMQATDAAAKAAAIAMFNSQIEGLQQLEIGSGQPTVTITHPNGSSSARSATVSYVAKSKNFFTGFVFGQTIPISGTGGSTASVAPNVDFYLMLDIPHRWPCRRRRAEFRPKKRYDQQLRLRLPSGDHRRQRHRSQSDRQRQIYRQLSGRSQRGITLRIDELNSGVRGLLSDALDEQNRAPRRADLSFRRRRARSLPCGRRSLDGLGYASVMPLSANFTSSWASVSSNFGLMEVATNNNACVGGTVDGVTTPAAANVDNQDGDTISTTRLRDINTLMPNPGQGTRAPATSRRKCCSSSPTASRTRSWAARASNSNSTRPAPTIIATTSRLAAFRSRSSTPTYLPVRATPGIRAYRADPAAALPGVAGLRLARPFL